MAGSSKITADSILAGFPLAKLSIVAIKGISKPNRQKLTILNRELNACAITVQSYRGNGTLGHLVLTCVAEEFATINGAIPFITPINPGRDPIIPPGQTERQISVLERAHANALNDFLTYSSAGLALKKLLIAAVPSTSIKVLEHVTLGYSQVTVMELLTHLWATYGTITPDQVIENSNRINQVWWNATIPIETLFTEMKILSNFAMEAGAPVAEMLLVEATYNNLFRSGVFNEAARDWRKKAAADKTWANLVTFFTEEDGDRNRIGAVEFGYGANAATAGEASNTELENLKKEFAAFKALVARNAATTANQDRASARANVAAQQATRNEVSRGAQLLTYCWTHGTSTNSSHTSATCHNKAVGHQDTATLANKMHGSEYVYSPADRHRMTGE